MTGRGRAKALDPGWSNTQLAMILNIRPQTMGRWRNGLKYPDLGGLKKIEQIFGWPASEQIDLIPMGDPDLRWSMLFNKVLNEWIEANPRDLPMDELKPLVRVRKPGGGRPRKV